MKQDAREGVGFKQWGAMSKNWK